MSRPVIEVRGVSKHYDLGGIGAGSLREELSRWWGKVRGQEVTTHSRHGHAAGETSFWALRDVSFDIQPGEVVGLIGRNGAGKSTLLKILSRITQQTSGEITLRGRVASLLEVGTGFHPDLTGRENIYLNGAILGMRKAEIKAKLDEIVDFAEVERFIDTPVKRYSSGMYVKLAFAVAAHLEPEILIVDEVLAVGDMQFQKKCLGKMQSVSANEGRTVLFVSHNLGVVANLCQRVILMHQGTRIADGRPGPVISEYIGAGGAAEGEVSWVGDRRASNGQIAIRGARTLVAGKVTSDVPIDQPVQLELDVEVLQPIEDLTSSIHLFDKQGTWVLCSGTKAQTLGPGRYVHRYHFPANFLNDGRYWFNVMLVRSANHVEVSIPDAISFFVHETGTGREEYGGTINGCVRPQLLVETEPLNVETVRR